MMRLRQLPALLVLAGAHALTLEELSAELASLREQVHSQATELAAYRTQHEIGSNQVAAPKANEEKMQRGRALSAQTMLEMTGDTSSIQSQGDLTVSAPSFDVQSENVGFGPSLSKARKVTINYSGSELSGGLLVRNSDVGEESLIQFISDGGNAPAIGAKGNSLVFNGDNKGSTHMEIDEAGKVKIIGASSGDKTLQVEGNGAFFNPSIIIGPSGGGENGKETGFLLSSGDIDNRETLTISRNSNGAHESTVAYMNDDGLFPVKNPGAGYVFSQRAIHSGSIVPWNSDQMDLSPGQDFDIRIMSAYLTDTPTSTLPLKVKFTCVADVLTSGDSVITAKLYVQSKGHGVSNDKQEFEWKTGWHHAYWGSAYLLSTPYVSVPMQNAPQTSRDGSSYLPPTFSFGVRPESSYGVRLWDCEMVYMHADQQTGRGSGIAR